MRMSRGGADRSNSGKNPGTAGDAALIMLLIRLIGIRRDADND